MSRLTSLSLLSLLSLIALGTLFGLVGGDRLSAPTARAQGAGPATLIPVADATIRSLVPYGNDGDGPTLAVSSPTFSSVEQALVRFDQSEIESALGGNQLVSASLELSVSSIASEWAGGRVAVHRMVMPWTEDGATWSCANDTYTGPIGDLFNNCAPQDRWGIEWWSFDPLPYDANPSDESQLFWTSDSVSLDVTADVQAFLDGADNDGWALVGSETLLSDVWVQFGSREEAAPPRLVLVVDDSACDGSDDDGDGAVDEGYVAECQGNMLTRCAGGVVIGDVACDDGNMCNGSEGCAAGACTPGTPPSLDDGDPCTEDRCGIFDGITHTPMIDGSVCDDGDACTAGDFCSGGTCAGEAVDCADVGDQCNAGVCDPATGNCTTQPVVNGTACDDEIACTAGDGCQAGSCQSGGNTCSAPASFCTFATFERHSYWFCKSDRSWQTARDKCLAVGMDLAAVGSAAEDQWLTALIDEHVWLGSSDADTPGDWAWSVDGTPFWQGGSTGGAAAYANWEGGQPDWLISGDCAAKDASGAGQWETFHCSDSHAYVCETAGFDTGEVCDPNDGAQDTARRDLRCKPGLVCGRDNGERFGEDAGTGVCWPPHCENGIQDHGETDIDCGGECGPCDGLCVDVFCREGEPVPPAPLSLLSFADGAFERASAATYQAGAERIEHALPDRLRYEDRGDGHGRVALFEGARTNHLRWSESLAEPPWQPASDAGTPMLLTFGQNAPDGSTPVPTLLAEETGADFSPSQFAAGPAGAGVLSVWQRLSPLSTAAGGGSRLHVTSSDYATVYGGGEDWLLGPSWRREFTGVAPAGSGARVFFAHHEDFPAAGVRALPAVDFDVWGLQWESGAFPTSYIPTRASTATRVADQLTFSAAQVPGWMLTGTWQFDVYPLFTSDEMEPGAQYALFSFGGADNAVLLVDGRIQVVAGGLPIYDIGNSWERDQKLTITLDPAGSTVTVQGGVGGVVTLPVLPFSFASGDLRVGGMYGLSGSEAFARISEPRRVDAPYEACVPDANFCSVECPCDEGQGGCDWDAECRASLVCIPDAGAKYGLPPDFGVCAKPGCLHPAIAANSCGSTEAPCGMCDPSCVPDCDDKSCGGDGCGGRCGDLCGPGEGGGDSNADCEPGLVLAIAMGARFDLPPDLNVCVPPICIEQLRPELLPCGTVADPCGKCPPCERQCDGKICGDDGCGGSCGTCSVGSCTDRGHCVSGVEPNQHPPPAGTDLSNAPVGTLPGEFLVNHAGEATYTVPLAVPPGRGGLQPNLALTYNSNRGNGYVGLGWAVEGFSAIARCNRNVAIDTYAEAPEFLPTDPFCLDGNRLVGLSAEFTDSSPAVEVHYRLESDRYMKISGYFDFAGEAFGQPRFFRVWTKDGQILEYGTSPDGNALVSGRILPEWDPDDPQTSTWLLNKVSDRTNNHIHIRYVHRSTGPTDVFDALGRRVEFYPQSISYGPEESPITIEFLYDFDRQVSGDPLLPTRADARSAWRNGTKVQINHLLENIDIELEGQLFRRYKLVYDPGTGAGEAYQLESVQQCDEDDVCIPPTTFVYDVAAVAHAPNLEPLEDPVVPGSNIEDMAPPGADFGHEHRVGQPLDMNGDGIDDILYQVVSYYNDEYEPDQQIDYVALMSNGTIGGASHEYVHTGIMSDFIWIWSEGLFGWSSDSQTQRKTVDGGTLGTLDYNNDGRQDILTATYFREPYSSNYRIVTYDGNQFHLLDTGIFYDKDRPGEVFIADANGDGYKDLVRCLPAEGTPRGASPETFRRTPGEWHVHFNEQGRGFGASSMLLAGDAPCAKGSHAIDANGDGQDEILLKLEAADPAEIIGAGATTPSMLMYFGRDDGDTSVAYQISEAMLGDDPRTIYTSGPRSALIDINGDGLSDVLGWSIRDIDSDHMDVSISISRGDGTFEVRRQTLQFGTSNRDDLRARAMGFASVVDVDRDGRQDLIATSWAGGADTFLSNGETFEPGLELGLFGQDVRDYDGDGLKEPGFRVVGEAHPRLRRITDGFGAQTSVSYKVLTDSEVHSSDLYEPDGSTYCEYPFLCQRHKNAVVYAHAVDEGTGGKKNWVHHYEGARTGAESRGFVGFLSRSVEEHSVGEQISTTIYAYNNRTRNDLRFFPFAFLPMSKVRVTHLEDSEYVENEHRTYVSTYPYRLNHNGHLSGTDVAVPMEITRDRYTISDRGVTYLSREKEEILEHNPAYGNVIRRKHTLNDNETRYLTVNYQHLVDPDFADNWLIDLPSLVQDRYIYEGKQEVVKTTEMTYYDTGLVQARAEDTGLIAGYTYNAHGGLLTEGQGSFADGLRERTYTWDSLDEYPTSVTNTLGHETKMQYDRRFGTELWNEDPNGRLAIWGRDNFGRLRAGFSPSGLETEVSYHPGTSTLPLVVDRSDNSGARRITEYDQGGRPTEETSWDLTGQELKQSIWYDPRGRVFAQREPTATSAGPPGIVKIFYYDNLDRIVRLDYAGDETRTCFRDTITCIQNDRGATRCAIRDDRGRVVRVTEPVFLGCETALDLWLVLPGVSYTYQAFDLLHETIDQEGNRTAVTVDSIGRKVASSSPDRGDEGFGYNAFGELTRYTNGAGETSTFLFDDVGRIYERRDWDGMPDASPYESTTWEWDGGASLDPGELTGFLTSTTSPTGVDADYRYDSRGLLTQETLHVGGDSYPTVQTWDSIGRLETITYPQKDGADLFRVRYGYAPPSTQSGVLTSVASTMTAYGNEVYWTATGTDDHGRLDEELMGNGSRRLRSWYSSGRLRTLRTVRSNLTAMLDLEYTYDGAGNLESRIDTVKGRTDTFTYDALDRLLQEQTAYPRSYSYDALGNLQQSGFQYNAAQPHALSADSQSSYDYDAAGRRTSKLRADGSGVEIDYTRFGLPTEVRTLSAGGLLSDTTTLAYDAGGRRARKTTSQGESIFARLFERRTYTDGRPPENLFYVSNRDRLVAQVKVVSGTPSTAYLHAGRLGTVNVVEEGSTVTEIVQDSFGQPIDTGSGDPWTTPTTVGFGGHEMDAELQFVNMGGRLYDPAARQFLTPDPIVAAPFATADLNPYSFAWANPLRYVDPTGLHEVTPDRIEYDFKTPSVVTVQSRRNVPLDTGSVIDVSRSRVDDELGEEGHSSPLSSRGFGERSPFDDYGTGDRPGGPDWLEGQVQNAAWVGAGVGLGVAAGAATATVAAAIATTAAGPAILTGLAAVGIYAAVTSYDYDAIAEWGSKFYGNELSVSELLTGGFIVGSVASGLRGVRFRGGSRGSGCPSCACFVPGTEVLLADGTTKPIEDIVAGEWILADNPMDGEAPEAYQVIEAHESFTERVLSIHVTGVGGGEGVIKATGEHPIWTQTDGWVAADGLAIGDVLLDADGDTVHVTRIVVESRATPTYNLTVESAHTYFVVANGVSTLVHNQGHELSFRVVAPDGTTRVVGNAVSAPMSAEEAAMGSGKARSAVHTEARTIRTVPLRPGETLEMEGFRSPCTNCRGAMNAVTREVPGSTATYTWYDESGELQRWTSRGGRRVCP